MYVRDFTCGNSRTAYVAGILVPLSTNRKMAMLIIEILDKSISSISFSKLVPSRMSKETHTRAIEILCEFMVNEKMHIR
jgi:hypothetical protein